LTLKQQRTLLIGIPISAVFIIVLKSIVDLSGYSYTISTVELEPVIVNLGSSEIRQSSSFSWMNVYLLGGLVFSFFSIYKLLKIILFFFKNKANRQDGYKIYSVQGKTSFSFFNKIQIAPDLQNLEREIVLEHEKIHVNKKHSLDILLIELFHIVFWFNPLFIFIKRQLINLHEYQVDAIMYTKHKVSYMQFLIDYALGINTAHYLLTNRFYNGLTLKKRIKIMKEKHKKRRWVAMLVPFVAILLSFVQCTKQEKHVEINGTQNEVGPIDEEVFKQAEVMPEYFGGEEAMYDYLTRNLKYPEISYNDGIEGVVYVKFTVTKKGKLTNPKIAKGVDEHLNEEALRVVSGMNIWTPGSIAGEPVAVEYTLPISFVIPTESNL